MGYLHSAVERAFSRATPAFPSSAHALQHRQQGDHRQRGRHLLHALPIDGRERYVVRGHARPIIDRWRGEEPAAEAGVSRRPST